MKKLTKSRKNRVLAGVLGGVGEYLDIDPMVVRLIYIAGMLVTAVFPGIAFYIIAALIMPNDSGDARVYDAEPV